MALLGRLKHPAIVVRNLSKNAALCEWHLNLLKKKKKKEGGSPTEAALKREKIYNLIYLKNQCEYRFRR